MRLRVGLRQFEPNAAARQFLERIRIIRLLAVQHGYRLRMFVTGHVVVADDKVYPAFARVLYFVCRLDTAIQCDDQRASLLLRIIHTAERYAVTFRISVGDIIVDIRIERTQESVHQCHGRCAVHIIIAVDKNLLAAVHGS